PIASAKGLTLQVDDGDAADAAVIETDAAKVRRILLNLCANGLNLTEEGGVTVRIRVGDDGAMLEVTDTGPGIDVTDQEQIFEEFAKLVPARRSPNLDLALAYRLAAVLGARITVS